MHLPFLSIHHTDEKKLPTCLGLGTGVSIRIRRLWTSTWDVFHRCEIVWFASKTDT